MTEPQQYGEINGARATEAQDLVRVKRRVKMFKLRMIQ